MPKISMVMEFENEVELRAYLDNQSARTVVTTETISPEPIAETISPEPAQTAEPTAESRVE